MRIAELVNNLEIGGAERMVADLSCELGARGHDVHVTCLRGKGPLAAQLERVGIATVALAKEGGFSWRTVTELAQYYRRHRIDLVHTHNPLVHHYGVLAARLGGVSAVVNTIHGPANLGGWGRARVLFEASCLYSEQIVACCEAVGRTIAGKTLIARRRLAVIANGIPLAQFVNIRHQPAGDDFVFGTVGRLVPVKDHMSLLRAFALVAAERGNCRLEILGDGPLRSHLEHEVEQLGITSRVTFLGPSLEVPAFLERLQTFILCSKSEGLPLTVLEAMAAGLPVVGTKVGAIPELIQLAKCGWLCDVGRVTEIAAAMRSAMDCPSRADMGLRGRELVMRQYSVETMTTDYERLFARVLEAKRHEG